jgi:hypothetical protein
MLCALIASPILYITYICEKNQQKKFIFFNFSIVFGLFVKYSFFHMFVVVELAPNYQWIRRWVTLPVNCSLARKDLQVGAAVIMQRCYQLCFVKHLQTLSRRNCFISLLSWYPLICSKNKAQTMHYFAADT